MLESFGDVFNSSSTISESWLFAVLHRLGYKVSELLLPSEPDKEVTVDTFYHRQHIREVSRSNKFCFGGHLAMLTR